MHSAQVTDILGAILAYIGTDRDLLTREDRDWIRRHIFCKAFWRDYVSQDAYSQGMAEAQHLAEFRKGLRDGTVIVAVDTRTPSAVDRAELDDADRAELDDLEAAAWGLPGLPGF